MKKLLTSLFLLAFCPTLFSQISYEIELLPDNETYLVSFISSVTYAPPGNTVVSGQVTIRMPHGFGPNVFQVVDLTMETPGAQWQADDIVRAPMEAPSWDYISFALTTPITPVYNFQAGVSIPVFSFKNGGEHCADSLYIIKNGEDPFFPPNQLGVNIGNSIVVIGGGLTNAFGGFVGTGAAPGTPETLCTNETLVQFPGCDSVFYQGQYYLQDTSFETHYTSFAGCDSVFIDEIVIVEELFVTVDTTICEGDLFKGMQILQDEIISETLTSSQGCDSTVTYQVKVVQASSFEDNLTVLSGQSVNGIPVFSDTVIMTTLVNAAGCDSLLTLNVTVYSGQPTFINQEICLGESFNGVFYLADTSFVDTLVSVSGFDSLVVYDIGVNGSYNINSHSTYCLGEPHSNGVIYQNDTTFVENLQTVFGCDSTIITTIKIVVPEYSILDTAICLGETYNGIPFTQDMVFTDVVTSLGGCDSLVYQVNLTVLPEVTASIDGVTEICQGDESILTASGGTQYKWSTGEVSESITVNAAGTYAVTVVSNTGCEGETVVEVLASGLQAEAAVEHPRCHYDLSGAIHFDNINGGVEPYTYSVDGGNYFTTESDFLNLSPGEYNVVVEDQFGCFWEDVVEIITPEEIVVTTGDDQNVRLGESVVLSASSNLFQPDSILWSPPIGLDCPTCLQTTAIPLKTTTYHVVVIDENGCSAENSVTIGVRSQYEVYVPNAFSPNDDGFNDSFTIFAGDNVVGVNRFAVFERWGGQVFSTENIAPNNLSVGWNGKWRDKPAPEGMYIWMAEVEFVDGHVTLIEGEVSLIR
ncbi:MAG: gliding motility-associated C-terminal domain-containing protein [Saprospiraceae bacterium]